MPPTVPISYADFKALQASTDAIIHAWQNQFSGYELLICVDGVVRTHTLQNGSADYTDFTVTSGLLQKANRDLALRRIPHKNWVVFETETATFGPAAQAHHWKTIQAYVLPTSRYLAPLSFRFNSSDAGYRGRAAERTLLGTWTAPNTFAAGSAGSANEWWTEIWIEVTTATAGGGASQSLTVSYTNQNGVAKTAPAVAISRGAAIDNTYRLIFDTGDYAARAITGVSDTSAQTSGQLKVYGYKGLGVVTVDLADGGDTIGVPHVALMPGRELVFQFSAPVTNGNGDIGFALQVENLGEVVT